jgi:hypothetical protein
MFQEFISHDILLSFENLSNEIFFLNNCSVTSAVGAQRTERNANVYYARDREYTLTTFGH